ncbi:MAG: DUF4268 domain-containing protein [Alkaliphilus sp.]|nr:DUF4268 domain-containing protein [Alkaliphilus sp.]
MAIDKEGNLVIIENKLDDSGKDVVWQALKYASYCSTLTKSQIIQIYQDFLDKESRDENAENNLNNFCDLGEMELNKSQSQRIFFIAANYRKEVTATVLWLLDFNVRIKCFKVTPYQIRDDLFLNIEQIIPMKDSEEYTIRMAEKNQEILIEREKNRERRNVNYEFWNKFLEEMNKKYDLYQTIGPSRESWISKSAGISGVSYGLVISRAYARVEFYLNSSKELNKKMFDALYNEKESIESELGYPLVWRRKDDNKSSNIEYATSDVSIDNLDDWDKMISFLIENVVKFEETFSKRIPTLKRIY